MRDQEQLAGGQKLREDYEYGAGNYDARRGGIRRSRSERVWRGEERQGTEVIFGIWCFYVLLVGMKMVVFSVYASEVCFYAMLL